MSNEARIALGALATHTHRLRRIAAQIGDLEEARHLNSRRIFKELHGAINQLIADRKELAQIIDDLNATTDIGRGDDPISS